MLAKVYKLVMGGLHMKMDEFLADTGWTKAAVAEFLGISRQAVSRWEDIPSDWAGQLSVVRDSAKVQKELNERFSGLPDKSLSELSEVELLTWIRARNRIKDDDICDRLKCRYPEFKGAIDALVEKYPLDGQRWSDHPFWGES